MMRPSLGLLAVAACLVQVSPVQAVSCEALARVPPPTSFHCGMYGTLKNPAAIAPSPTRALSLMACADACEVNNMCFSFGYAAASKSCYLYSETLDQQGFQSSQAKKGPVYYNYHCFACEVTKTVAGTTSTTSTTTTLSTEFTSTQSSCSTTVYGDALATFVNYVSRVPNNDLDKRAGRGPPPKTTVATTTLSPSPVVDVSTSTSYTGTTVVTSCSTTSTIVVGGPSCGISYASVPTASTSGATITCSPGVPTPSAYSRHRIEGLQSGEGTIFEDCILAGPRNVTTPSGGTHLCDGTNGGSNPSPGTTITDQLDAAAKLDDFGYDGTYSNQFSDYFITSISQTTQTGNDYWGVLEGLVFTPSGGCEYEINANQESQWIFNAFNVNYFLSVSPAYAAAEAGSGTVTVTVSQSDGNGDPVTPASGASLGGQVSDSNGNVVLTVPTAPGCYQYKAQRANSAISNAFYLTVVEAFAPSD